jgi:hypothetical protein
MKAFKVKYYHGHFIDVETKKRILPVQGYEYHISAEEEAFKSEDEKLRAIIPKNTQQKANWVAEEYANSNHFKLLEAGRKLFYRVGNSKRVQGDESYEYLFSCELLEDLYIYQIPKRKGDSAKDWRLCDCVCRINECIEGNLSLGEQVVAPSLNWLFSLTVMFYFNMQRSPTCNAFDTFFLLPPSRLVTMGDAKSHTYKSLNDLRQEYFDKNSKS